MVGSGGGGGDGELEEDLLQALLRRSIIGASGWQGFSLKPRDARISRGKSELWLSRGWGAVVE